MSFFVELEILSHVDKNEKNIYIFLMSTTIIFLKEISSTVIKKTLTSYTSRDTWFWMKEKYLFHPHNQV